MSPATARQVPAQQTIDRFVQTSRRPALLEPGSDPIPLGGDNFQITSRGTLLTLEAWDETHNLVRRVRRVLEERRGRVELEVERFGGRAGRLTLVDLAHPLNREASRKGSRLKFRERFRLSLLRQFAGWKLAELTTEADLEHSLSPSYPRAFLRKGASAIAAIGAAEDSLDPDGALTFGLIWLDYLRRREPRIAVQGLAVFLPAGQEQVTCHRVRYLNPAAASFLVFVHHPDGSEDAVNPGDYTNFETKIDVCRRSLADCGTQLADWVSRLAALEGVERRDQPDGSVSLRVRGLEFARASGGHLLFGLEQKQMAAPSRLGEIQGLVEGLERMRQAGAAGRDNPLYARYPEAWLESQVRAHLETIEPRLLPRPLYGQVPQFAGGERGVVDILAAGRDGRLAVIEIKASQDVHLPLQALDYWMRVKWHLERGEFCGRGYFPGLELRPDPPALLLIAPALDFHPSNETILRYFSPQVDVERIGVGLQWRQELRTMFRSSAGSCSQSNARSKGRSPI